ncbi:MAG: GDSL-type esterase/lipase family protein [Acetobacteraceae bacterium]
MLSLCRRFLLAGATALLLASCASSPPAGPSDAEIAAKLGPVGALVPLYRALATSPTVAIVQIGDSHTANDSFSGRMRVLFQGRFGDAGRGVLPPGVPYRWYRPSRVTVTSQGWSVVSSYRGDPGPFGIAGLRQHADGPASMTLVVDDAGDLDRSEVEILRQPGGGTLDVELDGGARASLATGGPAGQAGAGQAAWLPLPSAPGSHTLVLSARGDGPVDVLAWRVARAGRGVSYANLGTVGASVDLMDLWDPGILRQEIAHLAPSLIVLAFGTNEGFRDSTDLAAYAADFTARLRDLHAAAPGAALLVLGPPDGYRRRGRGSTAPAACGDAGWTEPPRLAAVREAQRAIATREGAYFWDWQAAMGGPCSMMRWAATRPPMAAPDHVHLYAPGYQATADELFGVIMQGYERYRVLRPSA